VDVGERVWVGGTKPGVVVFVGPTQFAAGEWVGVELDAAVGKNDGSVNGVRYFTCEPLHGVFAKAAKLLKWPTTTDDAPESGVASAATSHSSINIAADGNGTGGKPEAASVMNVEAAADAEDRTVLESVPSDDLPVFEISPAAPSNELTFATAAAGGDLSEMPPPAQLDKSSKQRGGIPRPMHGSTTSLHRASASVAGSSTDLAAAGDATKPTFKLGDRVVVSGTKVGTVRYVGTTEFAKGDWVGVELDEPLGKNDGSVQGKR